MYMALEKAVSSVLDNDFYNDNEDPYFYWYAEGLPYLTEL